MEQGATGAGAVGQFIDPIHAFTIKQPHGSETCSHSHRVGREGSRMGKPQAGGEGIHDIHDVAATGKGPNRKPATDYLAHRREIGMDLVPLLGTTKARPERDYFVQDQQRFMAIRPVAQHLDEVGGGGCQPHPVR